MRGGERSKAEGSGRAKTYVAFLSYATEPDYALAREAEQMLEGFHQGPGLRALGLDKLEICRDGSDFKLPTFEPESSAAEPIFGILDGYLAQSEYLIVFCSSAARGSPYVAHEIDHFLRNGGSHRILLALTEGADPSGQPQDVFPAAIVAAGLHRRPWFDLRQKRARRNPSWKGVRDFDDELVRLAAHLHGESAGAIYPAWQRRQERVRRGRRVAAAAVAFGLLVAVALWGWSRTDTYQYRRLVAEAPAEQVADVAGFAAALAKRGDVARALSIARASRNVDRQFDGLMAVARAVADAAGPRQAGTIYLEALRLPRRWNPVDDQYHRCIAGVILGAGFVPEVERALKEGGLSLGRWVAYFVSQAGALEAALRVTREATSGSDRATALAEIASKQTPKLARRTLEEAVGFADHLSRDEIVTGFLRIGDLDRARQIIKPGEWGAETLFHHLASAAADRDDLTRAREALERANGTSRQLLVEDLGRKRKIPMALALVRDVSDLDGRADLFLRLATHLRDAGANEEAAAVLGETLALVPKVSLGTAIEVAVTLADFGRLDEARDMLDATAARTRSGDRNLLPAVAGGRERAEERAVFALARAGDTARSFALARTLKPRRLGPGIWSDLISVLMAKGATADAVRAADFIEDERSRAWVLLHAVRTAAQADKADAAAQLFAAMPPGEYRATATLVLAPALARAGQLDPALALLASQAPENRIIGLSEIAAAMASRPGPDRRQVAASVLEIDLPGSKDSTDPIWVRAASNLAKSGELAAALTAAKRVTDPDRRAAPLASIAVAFANAGSIIAARDVLSEIEAAGVRLQATTEILHAELKSRGPRTAAPTP